MPAARANRSRLVAIVLTVALAGLLIAFLAAVSSLPARVYTAEQESYLSYRANRLVQLPPTFNAYANSAFIPGAPQQIVPSFLSDWETRVEAALDARYEEQEGVSVTVYDLDFLGEYSFTFPGPQITATVELIFPFPENLETLHDVTFLVDGEEQSGVSFSTKQIVWHTELKSGERHLVAIHYRATGANSFGYGLSKEQRSDVSINIAVNGLQGSDIPRSSLPASDRQSSASGEMLTWAYDNLIPSRDIAVELPTRLSFTQRVAQLQSQFRTLAGLAPVFVLVFLIALAAWLRLAGVNLRLEAYLLVGLCLALFYPALTFLSGLLGLAAAAILASAVISALVIVFLGLSAGWRKTWWRTAWLMAIFLGFFSLGILTPWRGLLLTLGGVLFVGVFMLAYARRPVTPTPEEKPQPASLEPDGDSEPVETHRPVDAPETTSTPKDHHCPRCGRALSDDHAFCPGCGRDVRDFARCGQCGYQQIAPAGVNPVYCVNCGSKMT